VLELNVTFFNSCLIFQHIGTVGAKGFHIGSPNLKNQLKLCEALCIYVPMCLVPLNTLRGIKRVLVSRRSRRFSQMLVVCLNRSLEYQIRAAIFTSVRSEAWKLASVHLPQIPQIFADVGCMLKSKS
jgi:hypothetical protein